MSPYLLLGFFIAGLLKVYVPKEKYIKHIARPNFRSILWATLAGIPLPLCSCGVIPTGVAMYKEGASKGAAVSFFVAVPQINVNTVAVTYSLLGLPFAFIRLFATFITGIISGALTNKFDKTPAGDNHACCGGSSESPVKNRFMQALYYGFVEMIRDIGKWLAVGILIAGLLAVFLPENIFSTYLNNPLLNILIVLIVTVPAYTCSTGSVPMAAVLLMKGLTPGAAFVFLMAGPVTSIATMTVVGKTLGKRTLLIYLACIITGAITFGLTIDYLLPAQWFDIGKVGDDLACLTDDGFSWFKTACSVALVGLIGNAFIMKRR
jgi:uncharacterized membrane protein YraQ (UPF0718 family)